MNPRAPDLTAADVATQMQFSAKTVLRLAKKGVLRGYKVGHRWRFQQTDVDACRRRLAVDNSEPIVQRPRMKARAGGHLPGWHDYDHGGRPS